MTRKPLRSTSAATPVPAPKTQRKIFIRNRQRAREVDLRQLRKLLRTLLEELLAINTFELSLYLVSAKEITRLNETFLRHRGATDVITFDYADPPRSRALCGEIVVCLEEAVRQARRFRTTWRSELVRYVVHAVLHLRGYDDRRAKDRRHMKRAEDRLLRQLVRSECALSKVARAPRLAG